MEFGTSIQTATMATQAVTSASSSAATGSGAAHTTIYAEQSEKFSLKSMKNDDIHNFADKLRAKAVQTNRDATEAQLRAMTTEKDRAIITQAFRRFKFSDGKGIENAENWLTWNNNEALCDVLKLVFPKSEGQSDSQKLLALVNSSKGFKIHHCKEATQNMNWEVVRSEVLPPQVLDDRTRLTSFSVRFYTTRDVQAGEELCWNYGDLYWNDTDKVLVDC